MINGKRRAFLRASLLSLAASPFVSLAGCTSRLSAEFVIVGSGPAGIALADQLAQRGKQVLVLEGGERELTRERQAMHEVEAGQWGLPYNVGWATQRLLGGTTNLWQSLRLVRWQRRWPLSASAVLPRTGPFPRSS